MTVYLLLFKTKNKGRPSCLKINFNRLKNISYRWSHSPVYSINIFLPPLYRLRRYLRIYAIWPFLKLFIWSMVFFHRRPLLLIKQLYIFRWQFLSILMQLRFWSYLRIDSKSRKYIGLMRVSFIIYIWNTFFISILIIWGIRNNSLFVVIKEGLQESYFAQSIC